MSFKNILTALSFSLLSAISLAQTPSHVTEKGSPASLEFRFLNDKKPDGLMQLKIDGTNETAFLEGPVLTIEDVESAMLFDPQCTTSCLVSVKFNAQGAKKLAQVTRANLERRMGIVVNGKLVSAPTIKSEISGGAAQIDGRFSKDAALGIVKGINKAKNI